MENIKEILKNNIVIIIILVLCIGVWVMYSINGGSSGEVIIKDRLGKATTETFESEEDDIYTENVEKEKGNEEEKIEVHVVGMVENPGVYEVEDEARVTDVIEVAGGALEGADLDSINLAEKVSDGVQIKIPEIVYEEETPKIVEEKPKEKKENVVKSAVEDSKSAIMKTEEKSSNKKEEKETVSNGIVNINTANIDELDTLPGIGPSTANKIISYRNENGKFNSKEEIMNVSGIGNAKYNKIKDKIEV